VILRSASTCHNLNDRCFTTLLLHGAEPDLTQYR
jgi:hypothetical protein